MLGRSFVVLLLVVVFASRAETQKPADPRKREPFDEAIDRGLKYLAQVQNNDGSWSGMGFNFAIPQPGRQARVGGDVAVTALAVMAFLSAGHVPGEGPYGEAVSSGITFVMRSQSRDNGLFAAPFGGMTEMYYHGICTLMLAEAAGMTDGKIADELKKRLQAAVAVILKAQRTSGRDVGGWRYQISGIDADLSVTGWQLMALRAAKNIGCDVPADRIKAAVEYVRRCHDQRSGGYQYQVYGQVTIPCSGVGILALELSGKEFSNSDEAKRAGALILKTPMSPNNQHFYYGVYYASQGMFQLGDNYWKAYREMLHKLLLTTSGPNSDGAWTGRGWDDARFGQAYCTAMAILALTVEYRYLPIYQRFEEPLEREGR